MVTFERSMIAPCGINCGTCMAFLRERNKCSGCLSVSGKKVNNCEKCKIRNCVSLGETESKFCFDCKSFPCLALRKIDRRYRLRYRTNLVQNLLTISKTGIDDYLRDESERWTCTHCGSVLSVHRSSCEKCGKQYIDPLFRE
jgi:hypothetical protein